MERVPGYPEVRPPPEERVRTYDAQKKFGIEFKHVGKHSACISTRCSGASPALGLQTFWKSVHPRDPGRPCMVTMKGVQDLHMYQVSIPERFIFFALLYPVRESPSSLHGPGQVYALHRPMMSEYDILITSRL